MYSSVLFGSFDYTKNEPIWLSFVIVDVGVVVCVDNSLRFIFSTSEYSDMLLLSKETDLV